MLRQQRLQPLFVSEIRFCGVNEADFAEKARKTDFNNSPPRLSIILRPVAAERV